MKAQSATAPSLGHLGLDNDQETLSRFRRLSEALCRNLGKNGIPFRPYEDPALPHFSKLPYDQRQRILIGLEETVSLQAEAEANSESLLDSRRLLWRALSRLQFIPQNDIFDKIVEGDSVEMYSFDQYQVFRNLHFFKYCSCTIEELNSYPVWDLVKFPTEVQENLVATINIIQMGHLKETLNPEPRPYVIQEIVGPDRLKIEVLIRHVSPVTKDGKTAAVIFVNHNKVLP